MWLMPNPEGTYAMPRPRVSAGVPHQTSRLPAITTQQRAGALFRKFITFCNECETDKVRKRIEKLLKI